MVPNDVTRVLIVEDNEDFVELVAAYLAADPRRHLLSHAAYLSEALVMLEVERPHVLVVDLGLPDSEGVDTIRSLRRASPETPLIVLTADSSEAVAVQCIDLGADDFLHKAELTPELLPRAIAYTLSRSRGVSRRSLGRLQREYIALADATASAESPVRDRFPHEFSSLCTQYSDLVPQYLAFKQSGEHRPVDAMQRITRAVALMGGRAPDILDIHAATLNSGERLAGSDPAAQAVDTSLLVIEMMGLLVDHYRSPAR